MTITRRPKPTLMTVCDLCDKEIAEGRPDEAGSLTRGWIAHKVEMPRTKRAWLLWPPDGDATTSTPIASSTSSKTPYSTAPKETRSDHRTPLPVLADPRTLAPPLQPPRQPRPRRKMALIPIRAHLVREELLEMTTDDFAEIEARLDRIIELLEGRKAKAFVELKKSVLTRPATGGVVLDHAGQSEADAIEAQSGCVIQGAHKPEGGIQINFEGAQAIADATIHELRRQGRIR